MSQTKGNLDYFLHDKHIVISFVLSVIFNLALYYTLFLNIPNTEKIITLHYNIFFGIDLLGPINRVYSIPFLGSFIILGNFILTYLVYNIDGLLRYLLSYSTVLMQIFLFIAGILVILLNI